MLEAFVTNLGRYNEGHLDGEYLNLPATTEEVQALLKRIHVDGLRYEEVFITDYETDIPGLSRITLVVNGDKNVIEQVSKQLYKLIDEGHIVLPE